MCCQCQLNSYWERIDFGIATCYSKYNTSSDPQQRHQVHVKTEPKRKTEANEKLLHYKHWTKDILVITSNVENYKRHALLTAAYVCPPQYYNSIKKTSRTSLTRFC